MTQDKKYLTLTTENFKSEVMESSGPVLVDFWAGWCGPCRMVGPIVEELAEEFDGLAKVAKVDVDENGDLVNRFGIMSIPTLVVFKDGKIVDQLIGAAPKDKIQSLVARHMG